MTKETQIDNAVIISELMLEIEFHRNRKMINGHNAEMLRRENTELKAQLALQENVAIDVPA